MRITGVKEPATKPVQTSEGHDCSRLAVDDLHIVLQRLESSAPRRASGPVCVTMYDLSTSCKEGGRKRARATLYPGGRAAVPPCLRVRGGPVARAKREERKEASLVCVRPRDQVRRKRMS